MNIKIPEIIHISITGGGIRKNHALRHATVHAMLLTLCQQASVSIPIVQTVYIYIISKQKVLVIFPINETGEKNGLSLFYWHS